MLNSFALKNVKSFKDSGEIEMKPLTLFVGQNSCGKSSLIRFPLVLSQIRRELGKLGTKKDAVKTSSFPLVLCGDLIDYGDFHDISFKHEDRALEFTIKKESTLSRLAVKLMPLMDGDVEAKFGVVEENGNLRLDSLELSAGEMKLCSIKHAEENNYILHVHELYDLKEVQKYKNEIDRLKLLLEAVEDSDPRDGYSSDLEDELRENGYDPAECDYPIDEEIRCDIANLEYNAESVKKLNIDKDICVIIDSYVGFCPVMHYNDIEGEYEPGQLIPKAPEAPKTNDTVEKYMEDENYISLEAILEGYEAGVFGNLRRKLDKGLIEEKDIKSVNDYLSNVMEYNENVKCYNEDIKKLTPNIKLTCFEQINILLNSFIGQIMQSIPSVEYIAPFRSNPERIYRKKGLDVSNVGVYGENMATVLTNLKQNGKLENVSYWTKKMLGYAVDVKYVGSGYCQVVLVDKNGVESNIIDTGYGVSQILPIILQLCVAMDNKKAATIVIEQPELHLHPNAQTELADFFVECVTKYNMRILCETHSEHLIRKLQVLIAKKDNEFTNEDLKIYYVDKDEDGVSSVEEMPFKENGKFAKRWPSGFFDKAYELSTELLEINSEE